MIIIQCNESRYLIFQTKSLLRRFASAELMMFLKEKWKKLIKKLEMKNPSYKIKWKPLKSCERLFERFSFLQFIIALYKKNFIYEEIVYFYTKKNRKKENLFFLKMDMNLYNLSKYYFFFHFLKRLKTL